MGSLETSEERIQLAQAIRFNKIAVPRSVVLLQFQSDETKEG